MQSLLKFSLTFLILSMLVFSCQDEQIIIENPPAENILESESNLVVLMNMAVTNDGSVDNLLDNSSCTEVVLPVTVTVNQTTITIASLDDLWMVEELFTPTSDEVEFTFPITVVMGDYSEIIIENQEQLDALISECFEEPEVIECVDFQYPISFSIYNTDFQIVDTIEINNDEALYAFLESLEGSENDVVLASLNFPVTLVYANGNTIEVNSNQALEEAINSAEEDCDYVNCNEEQVDAYLTECHWNVISVAGDAETFANYMIYFDENGTAYMVDGDTTVSFGDFNWGTSTTDAGAGVVLDISEIGWGAEVMNGSWLIETCNTSEFIMTQESVAGTVEFIISQDCTEIENPFNCFDDMTITACDYDGDGVALFDLETQVLGNIICDVDFTPSFYMTMPDAEMAVNQIPAASNFSNQMNPQTVYLRIENNSGNFQVFEIHLEAVECAAECSEVDVDGYLQSCTWNIVNYNGSDDLVVYELTFNGDGTFNIIGNGLDTTAIWSTSQTPTAGVVVTFNNVAGPNIQAITGNWAVVVCEENSLVLEALNSEDTMVLESTCDDCANPGILTNDLVLYMPFSNEAKDLISGNVAENISNEFVMDRDGNPTCAVAFTGEESFSIPVTDGNALVQGDNFSVSLWFKMQNDDAGNLETLFQKGEVFSEGFQLAVYDINTPLVSDTTNGYGLWDNDWNQEVDFPWNNTDWHHLVVTRDSNNTIRLYRDGILRNIDENSNFNIDSDALSSYLLGSWFTGHLDDLRVYKRTLSDNEVGDLYNLDGDCYTCL
ncbi:LamG domain-containing protein [Mangrovimonas sp. ST2L15]|uniref:LamG domain-containing protein n=1 Tax=Mangrovimonas sp. ST2L15 TaxID=1645916 RepID=UPI0006B47836|nr:LamG domain-containing protein [Mangrovimonas sp. ST2L15]